MTDNLIPLRPAVHRRRQLPEEVTAYVRELIMSGVARPGEFLRMEPIADAVGVSNTPVREGLLALRSEGFVELVPRRGFVVAEVTKQDIRDLFWTQAQFAAELAARAARTISAEQLASLVEIDAELQKAVEVADLDAIARHGHRFHRGINIAAGSRRLSTLLASVVNYLPNRFYASIEGQAVATRNDHPGMIDALRRSDAERARSLAEQHILDGADGVIAMLEERGLWAS